MVNVTGSLSSVKVAKFGQKCEVDTSIVYTWMVVLCGQCERIQGREGINMFIIYLFLFIRHKPGR